MNMVIFINILLYISTNTTTVYHLCTNYNAFNHFFSVDVTVYHRNFHGDLNETFLVGEVNDAAKKLVQVTWECLDKAIKIGEFLFKFL